MTPRQILDILSVANKLKTTTRHCFTASNRKESVADHSWRLALLALLTSNVEEFASVDLDKVIRMCLIHDLGEAFTGDVPSFYKTDVNTAQEVDLYQQWVDVFPEPDRTQWHELINEMLALESTEAKLYKALDKLEAVISHDESDLSTWLPLEYQLQLDYAAESVAFSPFLIELKALIDAWTLDKIKNGVSRSSDASH
ncbi:MAG: HD domain-containing protein [Planctomycetia bacterium]|nr:HD domain-containing protein [Planctomycetia bacterium]